jgi:hypothetical protein
MSTLFHRLKEVQIGEPIWQPVIFPDNPNLCHPLFYICDVRGLAERSVPLRGKIKGSGAIRRSRYFNA